MDGVDINVTDERGDFIGLYGAALDDNERLCDILLSHPEVDVNKKNNKNMTLLMESCLMGHSGIVKKLLSTPGTEFTIIWNTLHI